MDIIISKKLKKYVDKIAVTSDYDEIYGIETIKINNGIDLTNLPISDKKQTKKYKHDWNS